MTPSHGLMKDSSKARQSIGSTLAWVIGTSFAWAIFAFTTLMLYANNPTLPRAVVGALTGAIFGALAGSAQWLAVRSWLKRAVWWIPATSLGWLCAGLLVPFMSEVVDRRVKLGQDYELGIAASGLIVGAMQAFFHQRVVQKAGWLFLTVLAWGAAGLISWGLYEMLTVGEVFKTVRLPGWSNQVVAEAASGLVGAIIGGLVVGVVTLLAFRVTAER